MASDVCDHDPAAELPGSLQNRNRIRRLVLEMSGAAEGVPPLPEDKPSEGRADDHHQGPRKLLRTCLSSLDDVHTFGRLMAAEAHRKGFFQSPRQAFVADGMACNWTVWKKHFPTFTPIVDFLHAVSYVYHAAVAIAGDEDFGWGLCLEWTGALWQGRVAEVVSELTAWLSEQPPHEAAPDDDARRLVRSAVTYLTNNHTRMNYPEYPRQGLPITSSLMESLVKEIN